MNWRLIALLSLFGIAMGLGTAFVIPSAVEPFLWLFVFLFSAYVVARGCSRYLFLNGLFVGLFDSLLKTTVHMIFFSTYVARHAKEMAMISQVTSAISPRSLILLSSPVWGFTFGVAIGLLAMLFRVFIKTPMALPAARSET